MSPIMRNLISHAIRWSVFVVSLWLTCSFSANASILQKQFVGDTALTRVSYGPLPIYQYSDSLFLSGRLLVRGTEYQVDAINREFVLTKLLAITDTLTIRFNSLPVWVVNNYAPVVPNVE